MNKRMKNNIKKWRNIRGLSQDGLADIIGVSQATITRIENGGRRIYLDELPIYANALGVDTSDLLPNGFSKLPNFHSLNETEAIRWEAQPDSKQARPKQPTDLIEIMLDDNLDRSAWVLQTSNLVGIGCLAGDQMIVDMSVKPKMDSTVCAQVYNGTTAKTIFRIYRAPYLIAVPASGAPLIDPILLDNQRCKIMGTVTEILRQT